MNKGLTRTQKVILKKMYFTTIGNITDDDVKIVLSKSACRLKCLPGSHRITMAQANLLLRMLKDVSAGRHQAGKKTVAAITAALFYFISPIDLIADHVPMIGFLDDAFIILLCIELIKKDLAQYCAFRKLDPRDYFIGTPKETVLKKIMEQAGK